MPSTPHTLQRPRTRAPEEAAAVNSESAETIDELQKRHEHEMVELREQMKAAAATEVAAMMVKAAVAKALVSEVVNDMFECGKRQAMMVKAAWAAADTTKTKAADTMAAVMAKVAVTNTLAEAALAKITMNKAEELKAEVALAKAEIATVAAKAKAAVAAAAETNESLVTVRKDVSHWKEKHTKVEKQVVELQKRSPQASEESFYNLSYVQISGKNSTFGIPVLKIALLKVDSLGPRMDALPAAASADNSLALLVLPGKHRAVRMFAEFVQLELMASPSVDALRAALLETCSAISPRHRLQSDMPPLDEWLQLCVALEYDAGVKATLAHVAVHYAPFASWRTRDRCFEAIAATASRWQLDSGSFAERAKCFEHFSADGSFGCDSLCVRQSHLHGWKWSKLTSKDLLKMLQCLGDDMPGAMLMRSTAALIIDAAMLADEKGWCAKATIELGLLGNAAEVAAQVELRQTPGQASPSASLQLLGLGEVKALVSWQVTLEGNDGSNCAMICFENVSQSSVPRGSRSWSEWPADLSDCVRADGSIRLQVSALLQPNTHQLDALSLWASEHPRVFANDGFNALNALSNFDEWSSLERLWQSLPEEERSPGAMSQLYLFGLEQDADDGDADDGDAGDGDVNVIHLELTRLLHLLRYYSAVEDRVLQRIALESLCLHLGARLDIHVENISSADSSMLRPAFLKLALSHFVKAKPEANVLQLLGRWASRHSADEVLEVLDESELRLDHLPTDELREGVWSGLLAPLRRTPEVRKLLTDTLMVRGIDPRAVADESPFEFRCPITLSLMSEPVCSADGFTYERAALELHLRHSSKSPKTGAELGTTAFMPNRNLKILIDDYQAMRARAAGRVSAKQVQERSDLREAELARLLDPPAYIALDIDFGPVESLDDKHKKRSMEELVRLISVEFAKLASSGINIRSPEFVEASNAMVMAQRPQPVGDRNGIGGGDGSSGGGGQGPAALDADELDRSFLGHHLAMLPLLGVDMTNPSDVHVALKQLLRHHYTSELQGNKGSGAQVKVRFSHVIH